jgi:hypothetical protein
MAERHELILKLFVTGEEEELVTGMLNHNGFQFVKIGKFYIVKYYCVVEIV